MIPPQQMQQQMPPQIQQQMIPQQQMQQQMPPQINSSPQGMAPMKPPNDMIENEEKENEGTTKGELPCTINTFGFGAGHNENLLEAIAENGRGMYAFIENTDMIADTFAECLGGLVSIIGQNLKIKIDA